MRSRRPVILDQYPEKDFYTEKRKLIIFLPKFEFKGRKDLSLSRTIQKVMALCVPCEILSSVGGGAPVAGLVGTPSQSPSGGASSLDLFQRGEERQHLG